MNLAAKLALAASGVIAMILGVLHFAVLPYYDATHNAVTGPQPNAVAADDWSKHEALFVADLHADALLWGRNLEHRYARGHIDLPRLRKGGVDLQVFSVVTRVPRNLNIYANRDDSDSLPLLFIAALRSPLTWFSARHRALAQADELRRLAAKSSLSLVLKRDDLLQQGIKGLLSLEGMHALEGGGEDALLELHRAGFRMMGLTHFFDNEIAGSAHGIEKYGLTELGRLLLPRMERLGITIDLAHASHAAIREVLALATKPVVSSHGGVQGTCPGPRSLSDEELLAIASNGGVVGIGYWKNAVCDVSMHGIVAAILYAIKVVGVDHVGLGSDFDGHVATPFDTTALPALGNALVEAGLSQQDLYKVMGANLRRVLLANLPDQ